VSSEPQAVGKRKSSWLQSFALVQECAATDDAMNAAAGKIKIPAALTETIKEKLYRSKSKSLLHNHSKDQ
jgi:hypothetical protein